MFKASRKWVQSIVVGASLAFFWASPVEACLESLSEARQAAAASSAALVSNAELCSRLGVGNHKKNGPYITHCSGAQLPFIPVEDNTGVIRYQPSLQHLLDQRGLSSETRQIFAPDFSIRSVPSESLPEIARVPFDSRLVVPAFHGGGTHASNGQAMLMVMDILLADPTETSGVLKQKLNEDVFRLTLAMEAPNLPGSLGGANQADYDSTKTFMRELYDYFMELKKSGRKIVPIARSASTGYLLEFHRVYPGVLDGLVVMAPMHPVIGFQEGVDALYRKYKSQPEAINQESLDFVLRMYGGMDWSNLKSAVKDLPLLVLVGGQDDQVPPGVLEFYQDLVSESPRSEVFFIEEAGHDVYSFQNPELSLPAYLRTQEFFFQIVSPDLHAKYKKAREEVMALVDRAQKRAYDAQKEVEDAKAELKRINTTLQGELNRIPSLIEKEFYLRFQLNYLRELGEEVPAEEFTALVDFASKSREERDEISARVQEQVRPFRDQMPKRKEVDTGVNESIAYKKAVSDVEELQEQAKHWQQRIKEEQEYSTYMVKALLHLRGEIRSLRAQIDQFVVGEGPEPDFSDLLSWTFDSAIEAIKVQEEEKRLEKERRKAERLKQQAEERKSSDS